MNFKRDNWTNDEVISLLESCRVKTPYHLQDDNENFALAEAINLFYDFKADYSKTPSAKAIDTDTGSVVCIGPKLPQ